MIQFTKNFKMRKIVISDLFKGEKRLERGFFEAFEPSVNISVFDSFGMNSKFNKEIDARIVKDFKDTTMVLILRSQGQLWLSISTW